MNVRILFFGCCLVTNSYAAPAWWAFAGLTNGQAPDDYAAANLGQLKFTVSKAALALNTGTVAGAGAAINGMVASWGQPAAQGIERDDYAAVNAGQLKYIARLFYQRLSVIGQPSGLTAQPYPWSGSTSPADDWAIVNLGQLKYVFSFNIGLRDWTGDSDHDQIPDTWENANLGGVSAGPNADFDGDTLSNLAEYRLAQLGANPQPSSVATPTPVQNVGLVIYSPQ